MPGRLFVLGVAVGLAWLVGPVPPAGAEEPPPLRFERRTPSAYRIDRARYRPRGPSEVREEWILAQPRLTLPPVSPDGLPAGCWEVSLGVNRGTDFGWKQDVPGETPARRDFLVDGEHQTTALGLRYGVSRRLGLGLRVPVQWRGGGFLDDWVDQVHRWVDFLGSDDNGRPSFARDAFRVEATDVDGGTVSWSDARGTGLGNVEVSGQLSLWLPRWRSDWRACAIGRVTLPTGTGPFAVGGPDGGLQVAVARQVHPRVDLYAGAGGTVVGDGTLRGLEYRRLRAHAFLSIEYHLTDRWSWILTTDASSGLVANLRAYPSTRWMFHLSARGDVAPGVEVEIGLTENLTHQQATVDFGAFAALHVRF